MNPFAFYLLCLCAPLVCVHSFCPHFVSKRNEIFSPNSATGKRNLNEGTPLEGQIASASDQSDPMVKANDYFHDMYDIAQQEKVPKVNIMMESDYLVLHLSNGSRLVEPTVHEIYHDLKMVAHFPLSAYIILLANSSQELRLETSQGPR